MVHIEIVPMPNFCFPLFVLKYRWVIVLFK